MLKEGKAEYACTVASPASSYRDTQTSVGSEHEIRWEMEDLGEPPLLTPMIVCAGPCQLTLNKNRDGVHDIWDGARISLERGSRLAIGNVIQLQSSIYHMLSLHKDDKMKDGSFQVVHETEPFRFIVKISADLHQFLHLPKDLTRANIMTHIVTACLAMLQRDFPEEDGENGWGAHHSLVAFGEDLKNRGLSHWTHEDFFPETVATNLHPHRLPQENEGNPE